MKTIKISFILLTVLLLFKEQIYAQQTSNSANNSLQNQGNLKVTPEEKAQKATASLQKKLTLSPEQATQVYNITLAHIQKVQAYRSQKASGGKVNRGDIQQARSDYDNALTGLLNATQQQAWAKIKANEQAKRNAKRQQQNTSTPETGNN